MPLIALTVPVILPVAAMRQFLTRALPLWQWRCSDEDMGGPQDRATFERPQTVMGKGGGGMVMMAIEALDAPLPLEAGAPPHQLHLKLSQPSTDDPEIAKRMAVVVCASLMAEQDRGAHCQIAPGGRWYSAEDMADGLAFCTSRDSASRPIDEFLLGAGRVQPSAAPAGASDPSPLESRGLPAGSPAEQMRLSDLDHSFSKMLAEVAGPDMARQLGYAPPPSYAEEEPRSDRLPTFVLALAHPLEFDWTPMLDIGGFDPAGGWTVEPGPNGTGALSGRGCTVSIAASPEPIPRYMCGNALARSFWFRAHQALRLHTSTLVMTCDLDTRAAPFEDVRETAKIMTLLLGVLTRSPGCVALLNNGIHTLLEPDMVQDQVCHLHKEQIPVMLWTWTAPDSMVEDSVSLTTGGLLPFLGYEVEIWNAPGAAEWVGDKLSDVINYLLHAGPVVKDGDSFGESKGDRSIRGFFGKTRAQRADPAVPVLLLEFDGPNGAATARPDPTPGAEDMPRRAAGGFGRKGL